MHAGSVAGRVGTLALALAVGIVVTGGVASATEESGDSGPSSAGSSQSQSSVGTGGAETAKTDPAPAKDEDSSDPTAETDSPTKAPTKESESADPTPEATEDPTEEPAESEAPEPTEAPETSEAPEPSATSEAPEPTKTETVTPTTPPRATTEKVTETATEKVAETSDPAPSRTVETVTEVAAKTTTDPESTTAARTESVAVTTVTTLAKPKTLLDGVVEAVSTVVDAVFTTMLGWIGATPSASGWTANNPLAAAVIAFFGLGTRRETDVDETSVASQEVGTTYDMATMAAAIAAPTTVNLGWVTGVNSINNTMQRFAIYGTDLGIMWDNGLTGSQRQILMAFGDTFTNAAMSSGWRSNVLLRTADNVLSNGISVPDGIPDLPGIPLGMYSGSPMDPGVPNYARQIIGKYPYTWWTQVTVIPTGAISVAGAGVNGATRQYVSFMSVNNWGWPGSWTTNYNAIAYSDDNGQNWTQVPQSSVRSGGWISSTVAYKAGDENFQMVSFVKPPDGSADATAGYIYAYGTPSGRNGTVYLSRVQSAQILDVSKYQYWTGSTWVTGTPSAAKPVLPGIKQSFFGLFSWTTNATAGELSVQYNTYLNKYVMLSTDSSNNVVMRTADSPTGTWSGPTTLVTSAQYPGLYAPMIHPWSGTSLLKTTSGGTDNPAYLYWNMSIWGNYNVTLMRTDLSSMLVSV